MFQFELFEEVPELIDFKVAHLILVNITVGDVSKLLTTKFSEKRALRCDLYLFVKDK